MAKLFEHLNQLRKRSGKANTSRIMELMMAEGLEHLDARAIVYFREKYLALVTFWAHSDEVRNNPEEAFDALFEHLTLKRSEDATSGPVIGKFTGAGSFISWFKRVSFNFFVGLARRQDRGAKIAQTRATLVTETPAMDVDGADCDEQLGPKICTHLDKSGLQPAQAELLIQRTLNDRTDKEIAATRGVSEGTVSRSYHQAIARVADALKKSVCEPECVEQCGDRMSQALARALGKIAGEVGSDE